MAEGSSALVSSESQRLLETVKESSNNGKPLFNVRGSFMAGIGSIQNHAHFFGRHLISLFPIETQGG